jgi:hypothetical protein
MAETLEGYIARLKAEHEASGKGSLEWYLSQIRELAGKSEEDKKTETTSAEAMGKAQASAKLTSPQEARDEVIKDSVQETTSQANKRMIGQMVFFQYDPKGKMELPYWDMFPLIFPFTIQGNSMTAMNLHYLPYVERARLMMALTSVLTTMKLDEHTKLAITYKILSSSSKYSYFRPCIKKYLFAHLRSRLMIISPKKWHTVLFMPIAGFQKATEYTVWQDSIKIIRKQSFSGSFHSR